MIAPAWTTLLGNAVAMAMWKVEKVNLGGNAGWVRINATGGHEAEVRLNQAVHHCDGSGWARTQEKTKRTRFSD